MPQTMHRQPARLYINHVPINYAPVEWQGGHASIEPDPDAFIRESVLRSAARELLKIRKTIRGTEDWKAFSQSHALQDAAGEMLSLFRSRGVTRYRCETFDPEQERLYIVKFHILRQRLWSWNLAVLCETEMSDLSAIRVGGGYMEVLG